MSSLLARTLVGLTSLAWPVTVLLGLVLLWAFVWWFSRLPRHRQRSVERLLALVLRRSSRPDDP